MLGEIDDSGRECSGPLLVYVADKDVIVFGECRMLRAGPKFKASGYMGRVQHNPLDASPAAA
jgi:hypothetical protein